MSTTPPGRTRLQVELALAVLAGLLTIVTLISREWIELLTGWDPDRGSGSVELALALIPAVVTVASSALARRDWTVRRSVLGRHPLAVAGHD